MSTETSKVPTEGERLCVAIMENCEMGKIDWASVTEAIGVPTAGAAQKRWARLKDKVKKAPAGEGENGDANGAPTTPKSGGKKRKTDKAADDEGDENEETPKPKKRGSGKKGKGKKASTPDEDDEEKVKEEVAEEE